MPFLSGITEHFRRDLRSLTKYEDRTKLTAEEGAVIIDHLIPSAGRVRYPADGFLKEAIKEEMHRREERKELPDNFYLREVKGR